MLVQAGLCWTCSETTLLVFPRGGSNNELIKIESADVKLGWNFGFTLARVDFVNIRLFEA